MDTWSTTNKGVNMVTKTIRMYFANRFPYDHVVSFMT